MHGMSNKEYYCLVGPFVTLYTPHCVRMMKREQEVWQGKQGDIST